MTEMKPLPVMSAEVQYTFPNSVAHFDLIGRGTDSLAILAKVPTGRSLALATVHIPVRTSTAQELLQALLTEFPDEN